VNWWTRKAVGAVRRVIEFNARRRIEGIPHLRDALRGCLEQTKSTGCSYGDYWRLYQYVRRHKPIEVLELGGGVSTVVLAVALRDNAAEGHPPGRLTSMEEEEIWHKELVAIFPNAYRSYVDFVLSPTVMDGFSVFRGVRYRDVPDRPYSFVFVDGPAYDAKDGSGKTSCFDLVRVLSRSSTPVAALVDTRVSTVYVLQQVLGRARVRFCPIRTIGIVQPSTKADLLTPGVPPSAVFAESYRPFGRTRLEFRKPSATH
jgi:hypothetical protein